MTKSVYAYRNGLLCVEAMPLAEIAEEVDTPFYCISVKQLRRNYASLAAAFAGLSIDIHYTLKANGTLAVVRALAQEGAGVEVSSSGELERALGAEVPPAKILFTGVGKTRDDLAAALLADVGYLNVESLSELVLVDQVATILGKRAPVLLRINMKETYEAGTSGVHSQPQGKFGLSLDQVAEALRFALTSPHLAFRGLAVHIGANIGDMRRFRHAFDKLSSVVALLRAQGFVVGHLHLGGGLGQAGETSADKIVAYAHLVREFFEKTGCTLSLSAGRRLVGDAGILVTRVLHTKETGSQHCLVVDAGMNDLVRPALYGVRPEIAPVHRMEAGGLKRFAVVGPVSEISDQFGDRYLLPMLKAGDLLAIMQTGAYGSAMASTYNGRALVPEIMVSGVQYAVVRRRIAVTEQMEWEACPEWVAQICAA